MSKIIVGLSGGVDSSVAALELLRQGEDVAGLFMKNWDDDDGTEYCTAQADLEDAMRVADHLGIDLHIANFARQYWDNVFDHFLNEYQRGRTPNPDVLCNREIKFKVFADHAHSLGASEIATGHYARLRSNDGEAQLLKGLDPGKDQSYFLHAVSQSQLANARFPLGELEKSEVRRQARAAGLNTHDKKDSTGICFIGERRFKDFLARYLPAQPGPIVDDSGRQLGEHQGLMYHTIGQRQGLGIGGIAGGDTQPWYVLQKRVDDNTLVVGQGQDHPLLLHRQLSCEPAHWINAAPEFPLHCHVKIRYRQADQACRLSSIEGNKLLVEFEQPQRAVAPGQYAVFYQGDHCLGGAVIEHGERA